jgi:hypothetical protein
VRWRQVIALWAVFAALGLEYAFVERVRVAPAPDTRPVRRRFLALDAAQLREVRLWRGGRTIVSRRAAGGWSVVEPAAATIPPDLIAAFADALTEAEEIALVSGENADPRAFGLDDAAARVEIVSETGEPVVVIIGGTNPTGTAVYARRGNTPDVVLIGRNVRYYEDLLFQALPAARVPAADGEAPVG